MTAMDMMAECAPNVAPATLQKIIHVESRGNPIAVNANDRVVIQKDGSKTRVRFKAPIPIQSAQDAVTVAYAAIEAGHSVDLGYMQVNSRNLHTLGVSVEEMLSDGCKNIAAGARVLTAFYASALPRFGSEQAALLAALSAYNTGNFNKGFLNGYVARYGARYGTRDGTPGRAVPLVNVPALDPYTATTAIFVRHPPRKDVSMNDIKEQAAPVAMRVDPVLSRAQSDAGLPGVQVEYTAAEAQRNGAFEETALSEAHAWAANADLVADDPNGTAILIGGKRVQGKREGD